MKLGRLEAFADGVFAIIITIMVLEFRPPAENTPAALLAMLPQLGAYLVSFLIVGVHWISHHRLVDTMASVTPGMLWANLALLCGLSLVPFATANLAHHHWSGFALPFYMGVIVVCSLAFLVMRMLAVSVSKGDADTIAEQNAAVTLSIALVIAQAATTVVAYLWPQVALALLPCFAILGVTMSLRGARILKPSGVAAPAAEV
jgi:uncharacterized membrane protein